MSPHVTPVIEALVIGRLINPGSESYTDEWADKRSALYELTGAPLRSSLRAQLRAQLNSYYRAGDTLAGLEGES